MEEKDYTNQIFFLENTSQIDSTIESSIGKDFLSLLNSPKYSDIAFMVEGKEILAHKIVLSCRCSRFKEIFSKEHPNPIVISNYEYSVFFLFLKYLYGDSIELNSENISKIVSLSRSYQLKQLELICKSMYEEIIIPSTNFNNDFKFAINNKFLSDIW